MADMAESGSGSKLFVRQSSGLVRNVSVTNALFFNVAAFVGVGLTLYPASSHARVRAGVAVRRALRVRLGGDHLGGLLHLPVADLRVARRR